VISCQQNHDKRLEKFVGNISLRFEQITSHYSDLMPAKIMINAWRNSWVMPNEFLVPCQNFRDPCSTNFLPCCSAFYLCQEHPYLSSVLTFFPQQILFIASRPHCVYNNFSNEGSGYLSTFFPVAQRSLLNVLCDLITCVSPPSWICT
jgi:hypothetical protein